METQARCHSCTEKGLRADTFNHGLFHLQSDMNLWRKVANQEYRVLSLISRDEKLPYELLPKKISSVQITQRQSKSWKLLVFLCPFQCSIWAFIDVRNLTDS